jgi:hypothetical protein
MGLLGDSFDDPQSQMIMGLAQGLLSARGGAGLSAGLGNMQSVQQNQSREKLLNMQIQNFQSEIEARKLAGVKDARMAQEIERFYGNGGTVRTQPGQLGSGTYDIMPTAPGVDPMPRTMVQGGLANKTIDEVSRFSALTGKDLLPAWKLVKEGIERKPGSFYDSLQDGGRTYVGDPTKGIGFSNGRINMMPGAENLALLEGAKTSAIEDAKSAYDFMQVQGIASDGSPQQQFKTRAEMRRGQPSLNSPLTLPTPPVYGTESQMKASMAGGMGADPEAINREIQALLRDVLNPTLDAPSRKMLQDQLVSLRGQQLRLGTPSAQAPTPSSGFAAGPSASQTAQIEANRATLVDTAKADVQSTQGRQAGKDAAMNAYRLVDQALAHPGLATATGLSGKIDPRNYIPGTDAANFDAIGKQLQGNAFLSAFASLKGGGAITEVEGAKAESAIARLQRSQSTTEYKSALKDYQDVMGQGLKRMGINPADVSGALGTRADSPVSSLPSAPKTASLSDIAATAKASGMTTAQVTAAMKAKGYTIGGQ